MLKDIAQSIERYRLWWYLGYYDIKIRYRGSYIGPFWLFLSYAAFVLAIGPVYKEIFGASLENFMPYLAAGMLVWNFMSALATEASNLFVDSQVFITNSRIPLFTFVFRSLQRNLIITLHQVPMTIAILLYFGTPVDVPRLLMGLFLVMACAPFLIFPLALLGARFRDLAQVVPIALQLAFLVTPVLWSTALLKKHTWLYEYNPLYHLISLVRDPLIGTVPSPMSYGVVGFIFIGAVTASVWLYNTRAPKVAVWVG